MSVEYVFLRIVLESESWFIGRKERALFRVGRVGETVIEVGGVFIIDRGDGFIGVYIG